MVAGFRTPSLVRAEKCNLFHGCLYFWSRKGGLCDLSFWFLQDSKFLFPSLFSVPPKSQKKYVSFLFTVISHLVLFSFGGNDLESCSFWSYVPAISVFDPVALFPEKKKPYIFIEFLLPLVSLRNFRTPLPITTTLTFFDFSGVLPQFCSNPCGRSWKDYSGGNWYLFFYLLVLWGL